MKSTRTGYYRAGIERLGPSAVSAFSVFFAFVGLFVDF